MIRLRSTIPAAMLALLSLVIPVAVACGGSASSDQPTQVPATLSVSLGDNFFEPSQFSAPAGRKMVLQIKNDGKAIHNVRIDGADHTYNTSDDAVSEPEMIPAGGTGTFTWTPPSAGTYNLCCDFHPESTGTIVVG